MGDIKITHVSIFLESISDSLFVKLMHMLSSIHTVIGLSFLFRTADEKKTNILSDSICDFPQLETLEIGMETLGDMKTERILSSLLKLPVFRELSFSSLSFSDVECKNLLYFLTENASLRELILENCTGEDEYFEDIKTQLRLKNCGYNFSKEDHKGYIYERPTGTTMKLWDSPQPNVFEDLVEDT